MTNDKFWNECVDGSIRQKVAEFITTNPNVYHLINKAYYDFEDAIVELIYNNRNMIAEFVNSESQNENSLSLTQKKLNIAFEVSYDDECIDDIMTTALEGGITYWCDEAKVVGDYLGEYASEQISRGGVLKLHDPEEDQYYELTLDKFLTGLKKVVSERGLDVIYEGKIDSSEIDSEDADAIIQYAIFGEVVYG